MNFINNWLREITLGPGETACPLDLPDGTYTLTLSDGIGAAATRIENITAVVEGGDAMLTRPSAQDWPAGSVIYCAVTSELLSGILARLDDLERRASENEEMRAFYLSPAAGGYGYGYYNDDTRYGSLSPSGAGVQPYVTGNVGDDYEIMRLTWAAGTITLVYRLTAGLDPAVPGIEQLPFSIMRVNGAPLSPAGVTDLGTGFISVSFDVPTNLFMSEFNAILFAY